jgi:hypothetical protein
MTVNEMAQRLGLSCVQQKYEDVPVTDVYTSDLLSDVLANAGDKAVLVTIQAHKNTVAVGSVKESPAIIVCNDRPISPDMIPAAESEGIAVFTTDKNQFTVSGMLYNLLGKDDSK